ncbi:hypothetical protein B0H10DRAFT_2128433, partial [Mycena sp. CBHHK59/15]
MSYFYLRVHPASASVTNLSSKLFIPFAQIYGWSDTIPFHVQITGRATILRELLLPPPQSSSLNLVVPIRVYLTRQLSLHVRGRSYHRVIEIGEGVLSMLPQPISYVGFDAHEASIDWSDT